MSDDLKDQNSFQQFSSELSQKLNSKLYDRLMDMKKIISSKITGEKSQDSPERPSEK